jgi:hypothetical protein
MTEPDPAALFSVPRADLAALTCRFGCKSPVVGVFHVPAGCVCWRDPVQALCAQHGSIDRANHMPAGLRVTLAAPAVDHIRIEPLRADRP